MRNFILAHWILGFLATSARATNETCLEFQPTGEKKFPVQKRVWFFIAVSHCRCCLIYLVRKFL